MENFAGVRTLIDRMGLDARVIALVKELERRLGHPIEKPTGPGLDLVKALRVYVDGQELIYCITAAALTLSIETRGPSLSPSESGQKGGATDPSPTPAPTNVEAEAAT